MATDGGTDGATALPQLAEPAPGAPRRAPGGSAGDRYHDIIQAAAVLFAERGYLATSMRDIAERVGLLGGSLYHHIRSKEELFVAVHDYALQYASEQIEAAVARETTPWERLKAACVRHLELQLNPEVNAVPFLSDFRNIPAELHDKLIARRDIFERTYADLVDALPLPPHIDRGVYRLLLISLINSVRSWYRPGRMTIAEIGLQILYVFRHEADAGGGLHGRDA
ncbi:AcrR family transcriptional regulator [Pseudochelatococcus lubricantis]|uniref:AcrR family transcriptional regulator n=1 Tax=Pseudochelatococcus lubricantis TaxID=1538102 RepID=A0ABX0V048_9HYPH|nr:TetR/AcrR family transcriptional regulator [Pseudochelatococcus lubricantis]NIJ58561.1 AcrR family transcriptional regulator [Pseudochelatococcus lubricantis]